MSFQTRKMFVRLQTRKTRSSSEHKLRYFWWNPWALWCYEATGIPFGHEDNKNNNYLSISSLPEFSLLGELSLFPITVKKERQKKPLVARNSKENKWWQWFRYYGMSYLCLYILELVTAYLITVFLTAYTHFLNFASFSGLYTQI